MAAPDHKWPYIIGLSYYLLLYRHGNACIYKPYQTINIKPTIHYINILRKHGARVYIFFATGAVSGTMLSFELGLVWPKFMEHAGPIFGMPFSLEGVAFFY